MIKSFHGKTPKIAPSALISDSAQIVGEVEIGEQSSVWPGAVIRADHGGWQPESGTRIGRESHIEDNAVVHGVSSIGNNVVIGHGAVVEAFKIGDGVLIGDNATIMHLVEIGNSSIVAAGAVVVGGMRIPARSFVVGAPAKIVGEVSDKQLKYLRETQTGMNSLTMEYKSNGERP